MKTLSRTLSLIISFQLMVGCNQVSTTGGMIKTKTPGSSDTMSISGSLASTINHLSNFIMPSAMAGNGTLSLWDNSDLNAPVLIDKWEISGDTYSIKAKKALAQDKILKLSFESSEDSGLNREILVDATGAVNSIEAPINQEEYFKSKIFEAQLQSEFDSGSITDAKGFKARFSSMKGESFDSELALLGSNGEMLEMIKNGRSDDILKMAELINAHRRAKESGDSKAINEVKSVLFGLGQGLGVIKENQSILSCSANEGSFFFKDRHFDVFALSEDEEFIKKFGGVMPLGAIDNPDQARDPITKLITILGEMSKNFGRNMSARINFLAFDGDAGEMILKSCLLSGLPMTSEELAEIKDSSSGVMFDESFLKSVSLDQFSSFSEGELYLTDMYTKTNEALKNLLVGNGVDDKVSNALLENQVPLIKALYQSRIAELKDSFASPKVGTLDMEKLSTGEVGDFGSAHGRLWEMYVKALNILISKIATSGVDPYQAKKILDEQTLVASAVFERRVGEFFENFQPLKQPEYRLDLSPIQGLSFEGVEDPYALAKETLEQSVKKYNDELMGQKVDDAIITAVIEEQRNYAYIFIKLRIDEHEFHRKNLEILGNP